MIAATSADATAKRKAAMESPPQQESGRLVQSGFHFVNARFRRVGAGFKPAPTITLQSMRQNQAPAAASISALTPESASGVSTSMSAALPSTGTSATASL